MPVEQLLKNMMTLAIAVGVLCTCAVGCSKNKAPAPSPESAAAPTGVKDKAAPVKSPDQSNPIYKRTP